jgi:hypothetical protein
VESVDVADAVSLVEPNRVAIGRADACTFLVANGSANLVAISSADASAYTSTHAEPLDFSFRVSDAFPHICTHANAHRRPFDQPNTLANGITFTSSHECPDEFAHGSPNTDAHILANTFTNCRSHTTYHASLDASFIVANACTLNGAHTHPIDGTDVSANHGANPDAHLTSDYHADLGANARAHAEPFANAFT